MIHIYLRDMRVAKGNQSFSPLSPLLTPSNLSYHLRRSWELADGVTQTFKVDIGISGMREKLLKEIIKPLKGL